MDHISIIDADWLPEQDETVRTSEIAWARAFLDAPQPHRAGVYVNFLDSDDDTSTPARGSVTGWVRAVS